MKKTIYFSFLILFLFSFQTIFSQADAGEDDTTCNDTYTLNGNQPPAGYTGAWTNPSGGATIVNPTLYNTLVTNLNRGDTPSNQTSFEWTFFDSNGDYSSSDIVIITNYAVTAQIITPNTDVCEPNSTLDARAPIFTGESGLWTLIAGSGTFENQSSNNTIVNGLNQGVNVFRWTVTNGVCADYDDITINNNSPSIAQITGPVVGAREICDSEVTLTANQPSPIFADSHAWSLLAGGATFIPSTTEFIVDVKNLVLGNNTFRWTITKGLCTVTDYINIVNNKVFSDAGPDQVICNSSSSLCGSDPIISQGIGHWTNLSMNGAIISNSLLKNTAITNLPNGQTTFEWTVEKGICSDSDILTINRIVVNANAGSDATICSDIYNLTASPLEAEETGVWTQPSGSSTIHNPNSNTTLVTNLQSGVNTYQWTVSHGDCSDYDLVTITNMNVEAIISTNDPLISCTDPSPIVVANSATSQDITNPATTANGFWTVISGGGVVTSPSSNITTFSNLDEGNNKFVWHISNGTCTDTDTITIIYILPTQANAGLDTIVCSNTLNLNGNNYDNINETAFWRVIEGDAMITTPSIANTSVTNLDYYCAEWTPDWLDNDKATNVFEWVIRKGTCESTDQVTVLNGIPGTIDAGIDQTVCDNVVNLDALDEGSCAEEHWWEAIPTTDIVFYDPFDGTVDNTDFNAHVDPIQTGMTKFVWHKRNNYTDSQGNPIVCTLTDTVQITSLGLEEDVDAGQNKAVCSTDWLLNATPPSSVIAHTAFSSNVTGQWSITFGGGNFDDDTYYNTTVRNMEYYTNVYRWTITDHDKGCSMSDDVYIHNGLPLNAQTEPDREVCDNYAVISANNPDRADHKWWEVYSGSADLTGSICNTSVCSATANNLSSGVIRFIWHITEDYPSGTEWVGPIAPYTTANKLVCENTDTLRITNNNILIKAQDTMYVCADTAQLIGQIPGVGETGMWLAPSGSFVTTGTLNSSLYNDIIRGLTRGKNTFKWTLSNGSCSSSEELVVWDNLPNPNPYAGSDKTICENSTILSSNLITRNDTWYDLTGTTVTQEGYSTQLWTVHNGSGTFDNPTATNTWVRNVGHGQNIYYWNAYFHFTDYIHQISPGVNTMTCTMNDNVIITNNSIDAFAGTDIQDVCGTEFLNSTVTLSATPPNTVIEESGVWSIVNSLGVIQTPTLFNTVVNSMDRGENKFRWTISNSSCTDSDDVSVFVYIPSTAHVGTDQVVCRDAVTDITLTGNDPIFGNGTWTLVSGSGSIYNNTNSTTTVNNLGYDQNIFRWSIIDNPSCPASIDDVMITNNYVTSNAGSDQDICNNTTATLSANDPNIYYNGFEVPHGQWTVIQGVGLTFDDNTKFNAIVSNLDPTQTNILRWTVTKGFCNAFDNINIETINFTVNANVDQTVCDDWTTLDAQQPVPGNETGMWTVINGGGTFINQTLYNTQVNSLTQTPGNPNIFRWTLTKTTGAHCSVYDDVIIYNNKVVSNAGLFQRVCSSSTNLEGNFPAPIGATGNWSTILGDAIIAIPSNNTSVVTNLNLGQNIFQWTINRTLNSITCTDVSQVDIYNDEPSDADVEIDKAVCSNNSTLNVVTIPVIGSGYWVATDNLAVIDNSLSFNANVTGLNLGINTFRWTVVNQACSNYDDLIITNNELIANAGPDATITTNTYQLNAEMPPIDGNGNWSIVSGFGIFNNYSIYNTIVSDLAEGENVFQWTITKNSCTNSDEVTITYNPLSITDINSNFKIYPNPSNDFITINSNLNLENAHITLSDIFGKEVKFKIIEKNANYCKLNLTNIANGLYFIKIDISDKTKILKFVKK